MVSGLVQPSSSDFDLGTAPLPVPTTAISALKDATESYPKKSPLVFIFENERIIGPRPSSYNSAVATCHKLFPGIFDDNDILSFYTKELDICDGELAKISVECWEEVLTSLKSIMVMKRTKSSSAPVHLASQSGADTNDDNDDEDAPVLAKPLPNSDRIRKHSKVIPLKIRIMGEGREISLNASTTDQVGQIKALLAAQLGKNPLEHNLVQNGEYVSQIDQSLIGALLEYRKTPVNTAPTIYLLTPKAVQASVTLSLSSHWTLSGTCPMLPIKPRSATSPESITWKVVAHPGGVLTNLSDGEAVYKMAWEAQKCPATPLPETYPSPDLEQTRHETSEFNPNTVVLNDENAAILMPDEYYEYSFYRFFNDVFKTMGIDVLARICFESALKGSLSKHKYVAVRFLTQDFYSKAAPLSVSPSPDVITRIFVVFQGIKETDLKNWPTALERGRCQDVSWCRNTIGGDFDRAMDVTLFRVLELGGMEITPQL